jgi:hypothetical protein
MAEVVAVRHGAGGGPMRDRARAIEAALAAADHQAIAPGAGDGDMAAAARGRAASPAA